MKHTIIILAAGLLLGSCSLFNKQSATTSAPTPSTATAEVSVADKVANDKAKDKAKDNKRGKHHTSSEAKAKQAPTIDLLTEARWLISAVGDRNITAEEDAPYIYFERKGRFYAFDGCNYYNGDYVLKANGSLTLSHVAATMKYCPDVEFSTLVAPVFADGVTYTTDCRRIGQETYLYLKSTTGKTTATLRRHNMEFLNGNWQVVSIEGKKINDEEANIFIDIAEMKVHGNTGCNFFNGDIYIDPARSNAIDFSNMALTRMACPKEEQERGMMVGLEMTRTAIAGKDDKTVLLLDGKGKELLTLRRIETSPEE